MKNLLKELTLVRTGEPLDEELYKRSEFCQNQQQWKDSTNKFNQMVKMTKEQREAFNDIEDAFMEYNIICIETVYKLGYNDGILVGMEQKPDGRKSVLSLDDMANLISVYDSIRQLKKFLLGKTNEYWEDAGAFKIFEYVYDVIDNAACSEIKLLGRDESCTRINTILKNDMLTPEERAKQLLGIN